MNRAARRDSAGDPQPAPAPAPGEAPVHERLGLVRRQEHSLLSLFELSHELGRGLDRNDIANRILFNVMGELGCSRSALWLTSPDGPGRLEAVRCFGVRPEVASALGAALSDVLPVCSQRFATPLGIDDLPRVLEPAAVDLARGSGLALLAPVMARGTPLGFLALGRRASDRPFTDMELDVLNTSLGMVGVALENRHLYDSLEGRNRELERANRELSELDRMKSEFLQTVNHELRTPLAIIIGTMDCLLETPDPDPGRHRLLQSALQQAARLRDMVQTLLDFNATLDGSLDLALADLDADALAREFHQTRLERARPTHPEFLLSLDGSGARVRADRSRVFQLLDALLENALKFTPPGTRIELRVEGTEWGGRPCIALRIADDGPGIPEEQIASLFSPFRPRDGSSTRTTGGLGMGLAVAQRLAGFMGGEVTAHSAPGGGATLSLLLARI